jgi:endonuclease YncB( thermonuclease family)
VSRRKRSVAWRRTRLQRRLWTLAALLVALSAYQYSETGRISWPFDTYDWVTRTAGDYAGREDAGWRRAADKFNEIGARREGGAGEFDIEGRVVRVADGDTVSVLDSRNRQHKVRLFGIDTPERDQPHGSASRRALAKLVDNRHVGVVTVETDSYGRTVGVLYRGDTNINLAMVRAGDAWWYRYYAPHERQLEQAEREARDERAGLWAGDRPVPPWEWRRGER